MGVISVEVNGAIGSLRLSRPEKYNAMGDAFWRELPAAVDMLEKDPEVRVVVVSGEGKHFSTGLDLKEAKLSGVGDSGTSPGVRNHALFRHIVELQDSISSVARCTKPTIAAVHGMCLGGGVDLISACDMRFSTESAVFSIRETKIAIVADIGSLQRLPGIMPSGALHELALTGRDFSAEEAFQWGLTNGIAPDVEGLMELVESKAREIAMNSPLAVRGTKNILSGIYGRHVQADLDRVALWNSAFLNTVDLEEAFLAFLEKRAPSFKGE